MRSSQTSFSTLVAMKVSAFAHPHAHAHVHDPIRLLNDSVVIECWGNNSQVQNWMLEHDYTDYNELIQYYETLLWSYMKSYGKTMIAWEEIFNEYQVREKTRKTRGN